MPDFSPSPWESARSRRSCTYEGHQACSLMACSARVLLGQVLSHSVARFADHPSRRVRSRIRWSSCISNCATSPTWPLSSARTPTRFDTRPRSACCTRSWHNELSSCRGMRTIYIRRPWDDPDEDLDSLRPEFDVVIDGTEVDNPFGGLAALARALDLSAKTKPVLPDYSAPR